MGCNTYHYYNTGIKFSESDDDVGCLCTFPHNDNEVLCGGRIKSLAMLGAAIILVHQDRNYFDGWCTLPGNLPNWIVEGMNKHILE